MEEEKKYLIVITGPTAVGKTDLTIDLAQHFDAEIISCDSRQFYKEMSIGTAKPSKDELLSVKHHFVDSLSITEPYSAGDFERDGLVLVKKLFKKNNTVFVSGGSGLYIRALCEGFHTFPNVDDSIVSELKERLKNQGIEALQTELLEKDPDFYRKVDIHNAHRIIRALSVIQSSGKPFSSFTQPSLKKRDFEVIYVVLNRDRQELYYRINDRVDSMMKQGLLEEAKKLFAYKSNNALQTVGYQELFDHLEGKSALKNSVDLIKQNTRRYAKRQLTWFRRINDAEWFHPDQKQEIIELITETTTHN